jgi:AcrR family transcriptional regulator
MPSVTRAAQQGRQHRREALGRRLFDATEQLIGEGASCTELSVERLAARAGISRSTFYVHFQDKGELARKLASTVLAELAEVSDRWWRSADGADRDALSSAIGDIVAVYRGHAAAFTAVVETATYDESVADELRTRVQHIITTATAAIERGQAAGTMRDVPPPRPRRS